MVYLPQAIIPMLFALVVIYLKSTGALSPDPAAAETFQLVLFSSIPVGIMAGFVIYKQKIGTISSTLTLREKIKALQGAILIRAACLEMPAFFGSIATFLSGDLIYLLSTALMVILLIYFRPTPATICEDLQLSEGERSVLMSPDAVIE